MDDPPADTPCHALAVPFTGQMALSKGMQVSAQEEQ